MGKGAKTELPPTPSYQTDPNYAKGEANLLKYGQALTTGDFSGDLSWLKDTTTVDPTMVQKYADTLAGGLRPAYERSQQDVVNLMANTGSLTSSTASNALLRNEGDFWNNVGTQTGQFEIGQFNNAMQNKLTLAGMGLNTMNAATGYGLSNQNTENQFNLSNYENKVAAQMYKDQQKGAGWAGALSGGLGGAGLAIAAAPFTGGASLAYLPLAAGAGAAAGYMSPQSTSNSLLQGGLYGAGMAASNNIFRQPATLGSSGGTLTMNPLDAEDFATRMGNAGGWLR